MLLLHHARLAGQGDAARGEDRLRVAHAERLQRLVLVEQLVIDLAERQFGIDVQARLQLLVGEDLARAGAEGLAELGEARFAQGQARGHFVAAVPFQKAGAAVQRRDERKPFDAASAAFAHARFIEADDEGGTVMPLLQARRDDADHARMPARRADDDGRIARGVEPLRELRFRLLKDRLLHRAPLAILRVEIRGQRAGARRHLR